jgi:hypothetical protein
MELNGWQKAWFVLSALWAIACVLIGMMVGGLFGFFGGAVVGVLIPVAVYVVGLAVVWIVKATGT